MRSGDVHRLRFKFMTDTNVIVFGEKIDELARTAQFNLLCRSILDSCLLLIFLEYIKKIKKFEITRKKSSQSRLTGSCWPHESARNFVTLTQHVEPVNTYATIALRVRVGLLVCIFF